MHTTLTRDALHIAIIAGNAETADGLHAYFGRAGVAAQTLRGLADIAMLPPRITATVIFPDDLDPLVVVAGIRTFRECHPKVLLIVVTSHPQRLRAALGAQGRSILPVVLAKPAFGWTILDAVRTYAHSEAR